MEINVLGPGCMNCITLERRVVEALAELDFNASVKKVTDIQEIIKAGVFKTPALMINGKIILQGRVPKIEELKTLITKFAE